MRAEIISISSVSRNDVASARAGTHFDGFCKALVSLKTLNRCGSDLETKLSLQNWRDADLITADELDALHQYFGWELGQ
jgi:hypothetical protein